MGRDRDGQVRRPFADVFHLQPDGGFEFFARFRRLLQVSITGLRRGPGPPPSAIRAGPCLKSGREPLAIRYRHRPLTAGGDPSSQGWCGDNVPTEYRCYSSRNVPAHLLVLFSLGRLPVRSRCYESSEQRRMPSIPTMGPSFRSLPCWLRRRRMNTSSPAAASGRGCPNAGLLMKFL